MHIMILVSLKGDIDQCFYLLVLVSILIYPIFVHLLTIKNYNGSSSHKLYGSR